MSRRGAREGCNGRRGSDGGTGAGWEQGARGGGGVEREAGAGTRAQLRRGGRRGDDDIGGHGGGAEADADVGESAGRGVWARFGGSDEWKVTRIGGGQSAHDGAGGDPGCGDYFGDLRGSDGEEWEEEDRG